MAADGPSDAARYAAQLYVFGSNSMRRLAGSSVLILGAGGLGAEVAKSVILAGVKAVTIHDSQTVQLSDLASNFCLTHNQIGHNRVTGSLPRLSDLNENVTVSAETCELSESFLSRFECVVFTSSSCESAIFRISRICHLLGIPFILCESRGVFGFLFNDFGDSFVVHEPNSEDPKQFLISWITRAEMAMVTVPEGESHGLSDGDWVRFEGLEGMTDLNGRTFQVSIETRTRFRINCDTREFPLFDQGKRIGCGKQVFPEVKLAFRELKEALKTAQYQVFDEASIGRERQVVLAFFAASRLRESKQTDFMKAVIDFNNEFWIVDAIDGLLMREFAKEDGTEIAPMCAALGGIVAQEVLKAVSGRFLPLDQFLGIGYFEALRAHRVFEPKGDRYDPYRRVFGNDVQAAIQSLKYFLIGAGALGCETLKNWALMGTATRGNGQVWVTDMDRIERSNLNRQFLFRNSDIGKMKSICAMASVLEINPDFRVTAHTNRVDQESSHIYNDTFYQGLNGVCSALDNIEGRIFVDQRCLMHRLPLLDSGTLGTKGHFQAFVPDITENYGATRDQTEENIPVCTLRSFPTTIEHTAAWARDLFIQLFGQSSDPSSLSKAWDDCVRWARLQFEQLFNFQIRELQRQFPTDGVDDKGLGIWTGARHYPQVIVYDPANEFHSSFIETASLLRARVSGVTPRTDAAVLASALEISAEERVGVGGTEIFDKYCDLHLNFVVSAAIIRACNYLIDPSDVLVVKRIAGRIMPAIATTTAMVCGFIALEMYKVHAIDRCKVSDYRFGSINLAINMFSLSAPMKLRRMVCTPINLVFSAWDSWRIAGDLTAAELVRKVQTQFDVRVRNVLHWKKVVFSFDWSDPSRLTKKISKILVKYLNERPLGEGQQFIPLTVTAVDKDGRSVPLPNVLLKIA
jgi:ubiquitin-activating enzyme E1